MHARINYVDIKPSSFEEVDDFWRTVVKDYNGLERGYFLRDGESPHTLSIVVFETEKQMIDNTERQLGSVVKQAASHRLSEPVLHHMEVLANVPFDKDTPVGYVRVLDVGLKPERMQEVIADWAEKVAEYRNDALFAGGYMCGHRNTGVTKSITFWASEEELRKHENSGAMAAAVDPYREMIEREPVASFWSVRVEVI